MRLPYEPFNSPVWYVIQYIKRGETLFFADHGWGMDLDVTQYADRPFPDPTRPLPPGSPVFFHNPSGFDGPEPIRGVVVSSHFSIDEAQAKVVTLRPAP